MAEARQFPDYSYQSAGEPALSIGTAASRALPASGVRAPTSTAEGPPASRTNLEASQAAYPKHSTPPSPRGTPGSAPRAAISSTGRPERYHNRASELGTPGAYATGLSSSFEEEEEVQFGELGAPVGSLYGATPRREEQRSPQRPTSWVPPGMDAASYNAGERAAAMQAFHKVLPTHQALGQLLAALEALAARLDREGEQWRQLQVSQVKTASQVESALQRLDTLDFMRIPQLQQACEEATACRGFTAASAEVADALQGLLGALLTLSQQQRQLQQSLAGGSITGERWSQLRYLLRTAAGYAQLALTKADVAAMFLSRKILFTEFTGAGGRGRELAQRGSAAVLFVTAVEALWQAQQWLSRRQRPQPAGEALRPLGLALGATRAAVWAAAAVLGVAGLKQACSAAAEASCLALRSVALPRRLGMPCLPRFKRSGSGTGQQGSAASNGPCD